MKFKFNGELVIASAFLLLAGVVLTGIIMEHKESTVVRSPGIVANHNYVAPKQEMSVMIIGDLILPVATTTSPRYELLFQDGKEVNEWVSVNENDYRNFLPGQPVIITYKRGNMTNTNYIQSFEKR